LASQNTIQKNALIGELKDVGGTIPILGFMVWWSVKNVDLTQEQFGKHLENAGIDKKYAREHNYRSACIRALHHMEENRIIRKIEEDENKLVYQFTAENLIEKNHEKSLDYEKETVVVIDKDEWSRERDFEKAIIKGKKEIKEQLIKLFNAHKVHYKSSDITRYLQKILKDQGDVISLRPQGSIYFVPSAYQHVITKLSDLIGKIGAGTLESVPMVNVQETRNTLKNAVSIDLESEFKALDSDLTAAVDGDKGVTVTWSGTRINKLKKMLSRMETYKGGGILSDEESGKIEGSLADLQKKILGVRRIDLEVEEKIEKKDKKKDEKPAAEKKEQVQVA